MELLSELEMIRSLAKNAVQNNLFSSAAFLAEKLILLSLSTTSDYILYAKCYYQLGQPRRCLAILEQKGLLASEIVNNVGQWVGNDDIENTSESIYMDQISGIELAAQCLFSIEQYEDCVILLQPLVYLENDDIRSFKAIEKKRLIGNNINIMAGIYCLIGKCYDLLDHKPRALKALVISLKLDLACVEAAEYIVDNSLLSEIEKRHLFSELSELPNIRSWMLQFYKILLLNNNPVDLQTESIKPSSTSTKLKDVDESSSCLARRSSYYFEKQNITEAYRLSRQAYIIDPYDYRGLAIYIASMVELKLKTELFYLGHELVQSYPKMALSWYCVGCYYWTCLKYDSAQKYLVKATKLDKRCFKAWILLGHVLSSQEESEQAISAYRTVARLLPGDYRPMVYMAKELIRTNYLPPAWHMLSGALSISPEDPGLLNELAVIQLKLGNLEDSIRFLEKAVCALEIYNHHDDNLKTNMCNVSSSSINYIFRKSNGFEIFLNYATSLRKIERYEDALYWYDKCLAIDPNDSNCHASVGFTFHLMQRFDLAINSYHQALSIQPNFTFVSEMLSRAMEDIHSYPAIRSNINEYYTYPNFSTIYSSLDDTQIMVPAIATIPIDDTRNGDTNNLVHEYKSIFPQCIPESYSIIEKRLSSTSMSHDMSMSSEAASLNMCYDNGGYLNGSF